YARVAPEQKIRIVQALQERGEFVAMTGDGVNDAPALRRADIGVAMGRGGTDAAREAAHMILLDDNFATIVGAVREGRRIYDNLRKFVKYILTTGVAEIWPLVLAPVLGIPIPLLPIQILWVNLVTDGLPGLALAAERAEGRVMARPPRPPSESLFAHGLWQHVVWVGLLMGSVTLGTMLWGAHAGYHWRSMTFSVLALSQMGHVLAIRSEDVSLFRLGLWSNPPLLGAVAVTLVLQLAILYVPGLNTVFGTQPLTGFELLVTLALSSVVFVAVEIEKWVKRKGGLRVSQGDRRRG
ncbi:MAG TPA: HAD-IC family P-type ATPase, partial [Gemmatimonadales bacterium]